MLFQAVVMDFVVLAYRSKFSVYIGKLESSIGFLPVP
jgi:hypothetical protein